MVKDFRKFVEQMSDHDDLLQSICWTVSLMVSGHVEGGGGGGNWRLRYVLCY